METLGAAKGFVSDGAFFEPGYTLGDGRVQIVELIGRGAMGSVYKGTQQGVERAVAIKTLHASWLSDKDSVARFFREAKVVSTLDHPNIVHVYAVGMADDKQPYFVMEYLEGITLSDLIAENKLDPKQYINIFQQVALALAHAHDNGIVHRDIKPRNIVLVQENEKFVVKLCDFGIARSAEPNTVPGQKITKTGAIIGSPLYMSPEQCTGRKVDQRSDFYSLGCVMYEAASGSVPFKDEDAVGLIGKHVLEEPKPIASINRIKNLPREIFDVIELMMRKTPEERYQKAQQIYEDLESIRKGELPPYVTQVLETAKKEKKPLSKKTKVIIGLAATAMILGSCVTYYFYAMDQKRVQHEELLREAAARADRGAQYAYFKHSAKALTEYTAAYDLYREAKVTDKRMTDVTAGLARAYDGTHQWSPANKLYHEAIDAYKKHDPSNELIISDLHRDFGYCLWSQSRYDDAAEELLLADQGYKTRRHLPDDARIAFLKNLIDVLTYSGDVAKSAHFYPELIQRQEHYGTAADNLADTVTKYAKLLHKLGRNEEAAEQLRIVSELNKRAAED